MTISKAYTAVHQAMKLLEEVDCMTWYNDKKQDNQHKINQAYKTLDKLKYELVKAKVEKRR